MAMRSPEEADIMKLLVVLLSTFVASQGKIDWSQIKPPNQYVLPTRPIGFSPKIVGGQVAQPHQFPHQVAIVDEGSFCGGSIILEYWVLTAAHCVQGKSSVEVVVGAHYVMEEEKTQQRIRSYDIVLHNEWLPPNNDIALIYLLKPIKLGATAKAIPLRVNQAPLDNRAATISGWGRTSDSSAALSTILRYLTGIIIPNETCDYFYEGYITDRHLCLNGGGAMNSCTGDSGGPLIVVENGNPVQVGVVSFGSRMGCESGYPSVYTRVSKYIEWIEIYTPVQKYYG